MTSTKSSDEKQERLLNERRMIYEMIEASMELAAKKGEHSLEKGCNCIACVNKRKALLDNWPKKWKYRL